MARKNFIAGKAALLPREVRHVRIFQTPQIAAYFEAQSWYHGTVPGASFDNNSLTPTERANADFLANYETATWGGSYY